jgi:DnaJ domain
MRHPRKSDAARGLLSALRERAHAAPTLYDTLEVIPTASPETIHAAYRSLISRYHPDKAAALGPELQEIANARTKEINYAYDILSDAIRRASYDRELREARHDEELREASHDEELGDAESPPLPEQQSPAAQGVCTAPPEVREPRPELRWPRPDVHGPHRRRLRATLFAATAAIAALLTLTLAANIIFAVVDLFVTGHARLFPGSVNSIDANVSYSGLPYLLVMWVWLFLNFMFGLISYRLGVRVGQRTASGFDDPFAGTNDRLLLFLAFVCAVAGTELLFSAHTMPDILADMFVLGGAYTAERAIAWP